MGFVPAPYCWLPRPAQRAIESLDATAERSIQKLDALLEHHYTAVGEQCDAQTRFSCHHIALRRFGLTEDQAVGALSGA